MLIDCVKKKKAYLEDLKNKLLKSWETISKTNYWRKLCYTYTLEVDCIIFKKTRASKCMNNFMELKKIEKLILKGKRKMRRLKRANVLAIFQKKNMVESKRSEKSGRGKGGGGVEWSTSKRQ